jgi:hypothetical protein
MLQLLVLLLTRLLACRVSWLNSTALSCASSGSYARQQRWVLPALQQSSDCNSFVSDCADVVPSTKNLCKVLWWHYCCCWCSCVQVDTVISLCEAALAAGQSPVVGLQSTGEARTAEFVATKAAATKDGDEPAFDSFVEPAALILSSFIQNNMMDCPGECL